MADSNGPIASAVVLPESRSPPTKRRRSSTADSTSKRPRLSEDLETKPSGPDDAIPRNELPKESKPKDSSQERRRSSIQEEKKRGQRLFGGLLSTLSQTTPAGQQKRRQEIEKRQQEKVKQQKAVDDGLRQERLANLKAIRQVEQIKFDEHVMKTRHTNMLAQAHFLLTRAEPRLCYKPWELLPEEEEVIKLQISDMEALSQQEVEEFNRRHHKNLGNVTSEGTERNGTSKETVGEPHAGSPSASNNVVINTTNPPSQAPPPVQVEAERPALEEQEQEQEQEHNGEVIVENEEDTVIY